MKKLLLSIALLFLFFAFSSAQEKARTEPYRKWEIGANGGGTIFTGEWNMNKDALFSHFHQWNCHFNWAYGASLKKNFSHIFALEVDWNHANITGSWVFNQVSYPDFRTQVIRSNFNAVWNLSNLFSDIKYDRKIYWYGKLGAGISHLWRREGRSPLFHDNQWKLTIPVGGGIAYSLNNYLKLNAGATWSWLNTDRLDAMKTERLDTRTMNYETAIFGTQLYTYVGVSLVFGKKRKTREVVKPSKHQVQPELKPEPRPEPKVVPNLKPTAVGNAYKVYFAFDKWNLTHEAIVDLDRLARDMKENPTVDVVIKSHTDSRGPSNYNMKLSEKRGKSVIDYLTGKGISTSRINVQAYGESGIINNCKDGVPCKEEEHALNRRTDTIVIE